MADDPIDGLGLALNEDAKAARGKRGVKKKEEAAPVVAEADTVKEGEQAEPETGSTESVIETNAGVHEGAHKANLDHFLNVAENYGVDPKTLSGDIRDAMLEIVRNRRSPFSGMSEDEQHGTIKVLENAAETLVARAVQAVASRGVPTAILAHLKKFGDDGSKLTLTLEIGNATPEDVKSVHASLKSNVMLIPANSAMFIRAKKPGAALTDKDQPDLEFDDEGGEKEESEADKRQREYGFDKVDPNPDHPKDHSDLANEEGPRFRVFDPAENVYLCPDGETWDELIDAAGHWGEEEAKSLAETHDAELRPVEAPAEA